MIRVLLVSETPADFETAAVLRALTDAAAGADLAIEHVPLPPAGATVAAVHDLLRRNERAGGFDVLHAFGPRALLATAAVGCQPIAYTPPPAEPVARLSRLRRVMAVRSVRVACNSAVARAELLSAGVPPSAVTVLPPLPPVPATAAAATRSPAEVRAALGLSPDDRVMLAAGEPTRSARLDHAIWSAVILNYLDRRHRIVACDRGPAGDRLRRFADSLAQPGFCAFAPPELDWATLAAAADVAVWSAVRATATLPLLGVAAAGVPVVDVSRVRPRVAAQRLLRWFEHPGERPSLQARPAGQFSAPADWRQLYKDLLVGRRADTPPRRSAGVLAAR